MKTISMPKNARPHVYRITCKNEECAAVMECRRSELRFDSDRDGYFAVMKCPHCDTETYVGTSALDAAKGGR